MNTTSSFAIQSKEERPRCDASLHLGTLRRLTYALRLSGVLVVLIAAATFLLQGPFSSWPAGRLLGFLFFIVSLGVSGFATGVVFQETKGARTFLGLGILLSTAAWAQLGGLVYATSATEVLWMPSILRFQGISFELLALLIVLCGLVTTTTSFAGFSVLIRNWRHTFTSFALALGLICLLPVRDPGLVAILAAALLVILSHRLILLEKQSGRRMTGEELVAALALLAPIFLIMTRSYCYGLGYPLLAVGSAWLGFLGVIWGPARTEAQSYQRASVSAGVLAWALTWYTVTSCLFFIDGEAWYLTPLGTLSDEFRSVITWYPLCFGLYLFGIRSDYHSPLLRRAALVTAAWIALQQVHLDVGCVPSIMAIVVSVACLTDGYTRGERWSLLVGGYLLIIGLFQHIKEAVLILSMSPWLSLAIIGVLILFASSYFERVVHRVAPSESVDE